MTNEKNDSSESPIITIVTIIVVILLALFVWPWFGGWDLLNVTGRDSIRNPDDCIIEKVEDGKVKCGLF